MPPFTTSSPSSLDGVRAAYRAYVARSYREEFGMNDAAQADAVADDWLDADMSVASPHEEHFAELTRLPGVPRILDLASGMGTAALRGLAAGRDVRGVEPDAEKLALMRRRIIAGGLPAAWISRFARAVGERLPYKNEVFDAVLSYQTLEHVQDVEAVIAEMLRVVRPGGALHLRCPDYRGTFEGHYLLPWWPLMPRPLARAYLYARGRPASGLAGIVYVTRRRLRRAVLAASARAGHAVDIVDLERERIRARLAARRLPSSLVFVRLAEAALYVRRLFRAETQVNLWVTKHAAQQG